MTRKDVSFDKVKKIEKKEQKLFTAGYFIPFHFLHIYLKILEGNIPKYQSFPKVLCEVFMFILFCMFQIFYNKNKILPFSPKQLNLFTFYCNCNELFQFLNYVKIVLWCLLFSGMFFFPFSWLAALYYFMSVLKHCFLSETMECTMLLSILSHYLVPFSAWYYLKLYYKSFNLIICLVSDYCISKQNYQGNRNLACLI